jgi:hypothetical protein
MACCIMPWQPTSMVDRKVAETFAEWHLRPKNFIEGARRFAPAASLSAAPGTWVDQARYSRDGLSKDRHPFERSL